MAVRSNACVFKCLVRISREHYVENDMVLYIHKFSQVREDFENFEPGVACTDEKCVIE